MDYIDNLSMLTTIPKESLSKLVKYINLVHSNDMVNDLLSDKDIFEIEIFEGKIILKYENDSLHYKFIPNNEFNSMMINTVLSGKSKLELAISDRLKNTLINWRKELL